jgi:hypothetical protein
VNPVGTTRLSGFKKGTLMPTPAASERGKPAEDNTMLQAAIRRDAYQAAHAAVVKCSTLTGPAAQEVARKAVDAATPKIRAEYAAAVSGMSHREAVAGAAAVIGILTLDLVALGRSLRHGGRVARAATAAAIAGRVAVAGWARWRETRIRRAVREMPAVKA